jgi:hypothetical protein
MRGQRAAFSRRAVACVAASLSLHLVVGVGAASVFLGGTVVGYLWRGENPLIVDILVGEDRGRTAPSVRPGPGRPPRASPPRALTSAGVSEATPTETAPTRFSERAVPVSPVRPGAEQVAVEPPAPDVVTHTEPTLVEVSRVGEPLATGESLHEGDGPGREDRPVARGDEAVTVTEPTPADSPAHIPLAATASNQARLDEVTRYPSLSARAESEAIVGRREVFEFLLDHPDFATHITRALRLGRYRIWRTDDGMFIDDGWGATGQITVMHAASGTRVLYAKGEFQHKFLPSIPGEAVVTIDYDTRPTEDGRELLQARISGQLKIDSAFAALMLKIASTVAREKADKESRRLMQTFARVLRAIDETPAAVYASLQGRPDVPRLELEQFRVLLGLP